MPGKSEPNNDASRDESDDAYRDDPSELAQSSDYAQRGTTGQYSGNSPGEAPDNYGTLHATQGNNAGSQQDWRDGPKPGEELTPKDDDEEIRSRSADPGQGSYGGFKHEGPGPGGDHDAALPDPIPDPQAAVNPDATPDRESDVKSDVKSDKKP